MLQRISTMQRYYGFLTIFVNGCILAGNNRVVLFSGTTTLVYGEIFSACLVFSFKCNYYREYWKIAEKH